MEGAASGHSAVALKFREALSAKRVLNGTLVAAVGIASVFWPPVFALLILAISCVGAWEFSKLGKRIGAEPSLWVTMTACAAYLALAYAGRLDRYESVLVAALILAALLASFAVGVEHFATRVGMTLFATMYLGKLFSYFVLLRMTAHGLGLVLLTIVVVSLTDIVGMIAGLRFGRRPMAPRYSPSKTWEGAVVGFAVATAVGTGLATLPQVGVPWWLGLALCGCVSVAAEFGDLVESALKRNAQVKDSGQLIAGHGGALDRFDSYFFAGVVAYTVMHLAGRLQ